MRLCNVANMNTQTYHKQDTLEQAMLIEWLIHPRTDRLLRVD